MDCLTELEYYCGEKNPAGALLLTGEWGCGKTYFVEHELKNALQHSHILVRISLFGIATTDELHAIVKKKWIEAVIQEKGISKQSIEMGEKAAKVVTEMAAKLKDIVPESIKNMGSVLSVDIMDCISIKNIIGEKKVVLIFDDLERSNLSETDCFGCINEYCENQNFNTIIIANEDRIGEKEEAKLTYKEIKEKLIQRTIKFELNYKRVISDIVSKNNWNNPHYAEFLGENVNLITTIFSGMAPDGSSINSKAGDFAKKSKYNMEQRDEEKRRRKLLQKRPHNIRSLKCALQDFERIYNLLDEKQINDEDRWLSSYITYVFAWRAGLIAEATEYGDLFSQDSLAVLYPGYYNSRYMVSGVIDWIKSGKWDQNRLNMDLDDVIERDKAKNPRDLVQMNRIMDLEDDIVLQGFPEVLSLAYEGRISLDEYVLLIENVCMARQYKVNIPEVDWGKMQSVLKAKISELQRNGDGQERLRRRIDSDQNSYFLQEELAAYQIIQSAFEDGGFVYARNQKHYIDLMKENSNSAFEYAKSHRYNVFNVAMSEVTAAAFERASNADKGYFIDCFKGVWKDYRDMQDIKLEETKDGFRDLESRLTDFLVRYKKDNKQIAAAYTERFIEVIQQLVEVE